MHSVKGYVRGRVQGVGFRYFVRTAAQRHGLCGYAQNLADGRVEVLAQGESDSIDHLVTWLWAGPSHAIVTGVESDVVAADRTLKDFFIHPNPSKSH